ncbi:hypothetical protein [Mycoplana ramosa]|uniref:LTXXQ motif family protein n=1 Tax=Mycoplana ramosa TaxID=40837 RepID=A0ABW3YUE1_MYCRA
MTDLNPPHSYKVRTTLVLALALPLVATAALPALAQDAGQPMQPGMMHPGMAAGMHGEHGDDRMDRGYRHGEYRHDRDRGPRRWHGARVGEWLAMRLAAAETAAGIKTAQLDAWRTFTAAFVDFATPMPARAGMMTDDESMMMEGEEADVAPGSDEAQTPTGDQQAAGGDRAAQGGFDMLDRMIARVENRAQKAEKLKAAKTALEAVLEPGQKETITRFLMPRRHFGGRD